jgi:hypothetical protein
LVELRCFRRFGPGVLTQCIGSGVGSGVGSDVGSIVGSGVFDDRDVNVFMTDTKQDRKTKMASTNRPEAPIEAGPGSLCVLIDSRTSERVDRTRLTPSQPRLVYGHSSRRVWRLLSVLCEVLCMTVDCYWLVSKA